MVRKATQANTGTEASKASPTTDAAQRAADASAKVTAALLVIRSEENAEYTSRASHDAAITTAWLTVCEAIRPIKSGLFAQIGFKSFQAYAEETFGNSPKYQTVNAYCLASDVPECAARWNALGMGAAVSLATMLRNKKYSAAETKHAILLADKCDAAYAATCAVSTDEVILKSQRALEASRAAILAYSKQLRKEHKAAPATVADKASTLKTPEACTKELESVKTKREELREWELTVKARMSELKKGSSGKVSSKGAAPSDPSLPIRRQLDQAVKDGVMTRAAADVFLKNLGYMPRPARGNKGENSK
jgi:hypothetical protein